MRAMAFGPPGPMAEASLDPMEAKNKERYFRSVTSLTSKALRPRLQLFLGGAWPVS